MQHLVAERPIFEHDQHMVRAVSLTFFCILTACVSPIPIPSAPPPSRQPTAAELTPCGAISHQSLVGQPAEVLERVLIMQEMRLIRPGMAVTADYRPTRLNIEINAAGYITSVTCG